MWRVEANRNRPKFAIFHAHCAPRHIHTDFKQPSQVLFKCWKIWTFNFKQSVDNFLCKSRRCQNSQWNRQYLCLLHKSCYYCRCVISFVFHRFDFNDCDCRLSNFLTNFFLFSCLFSMLCSITQPTDQRQKSKGGSSSCCSRHCCIL